MVLFTLRGFSQGEIIFMTAFFFFIVILAVMLHFLYPGSAQVYFGELWPIGITTYVIDEGHVLKLSLKNNYGESITIYGFYVNNTFYETDTRLSRYKPTEKISINLKKFTCEANAQYSIPFGYKYKTQDMDEPQELMAEVPLTGKCKEA
ncbi:MAG: hypothetical protein N3E37_05130 [Candidatus Micrarchaeota archaeon]|nr:hypothetical protein [Candidatus Micrarchaeota archaeon]